MTKNKEDISIKGKIKKYTVITLKLATVFGFFWLVNLFIQTAFVDNPLDQYVITRTCDFILMGDFSVATCDDGTHWTVSPFQIADNQ